MKRILLGSIIGCVATLPMTVVLILLQRQLPLWERFAFPPFKVSMEASKIIGIKRAMGPAQRLGLTLAAHFGFGAAAGALYGLLADKLPRPPALWGALYGIFVWAASYFGWLPLTGLYRPPTQESPRRQAMMAAGHLVWGPIVGVLFDQLAE